ncbi:MAG: GNAT family N-acetyltransferase [Candidatus Marinimicrobia bacterium]|nr:GNAT family N-acetyltransferase [Candidatus Neomarinimicrobiota bacterium]
MLKIRNFEKNEADYRAFVDVDNAVWSDFPWTVEEWKHNDQSRNPEYLYKRLVVEKNGKIVGYANYGECSWDYVPGKYSIFISVHPDYQRKGIGTTLYEHVLDILSKRNPKQLVVTTREDKKGAIHFLEKHQFKLIQREPVSHLRIDSFDFKKYEWVFSEMKAQGIQLFLLSQLQEIDPVWDRKLWELDWEIVQDIPSPDPPTRQPFEIWKKHELESPNYNPDTWIVAVDGDRYVGMSNLNTSQAEPEKTFTDLTGVVRSHRRKYIATAMKIRGIKAAKKYGTKIIVTENEENNPMFYLNIQLGFEPKPAWLHFRKELDGK